MKHAGNDLFLLIKSMNQSEKRYFTIVGAPYDKKGEGNKYLALFEKIGRQKKYDEAALKEYFRSDAFLGKYFKKAKAHLYNLVLSTLERYHSDENSDVQRLLKQSRILFKKGLYVQSHKLLLKAKKTATDMEYFTALLEVREQERHFLSVNMEFRGNTVRQLPVELKKNMEKLTNLHAIWALQEKIFSHFSKTELVQTKGQLKKITAKAGKLFDKHPVPASKKAGITLYNTLAAYYLKIGLFKKAQLNSRKELDQYVGQENENSVLNQVMISGNYISACLGLKEFDKVLMEVDRLFSMCEAYPNNKRVKPFLCYLCHAGANAYLSSGKFNEGITFIERTKKYFSDASLRDRILYAMHAAIFNLGTGNYRQTLFYTNMIINVPENENPVPVTIYWSKLLQLLTLWEKKDYELLGYRTKSFYQYLQKRNLLNRFEILTLDFMKLLSTEPKMHSTSRGLKNELIKFKKALLQIMAEGSVIEEEFDFLSWVESKIQNKPFTEILREKSRR